MIPAERKDYPYCHQITVEFAPGEKVKIANGEFNAIVSCVSTSYPSHSRYQCIWWNDGKRFEEWFDSFEIEARS